MHYIISIYSYFVIIIIFILLKTTLEYEGKMSVEDQRLKLVQWTDCVESAAEALTHLDVALKDIVNHAKLFQGEKLTTYKPQ